MNTPSTQAIVRSVLTAGILGLALTGARAQDNGVVWTPYGNLPAGVTVVNLSPSAPYTTNKFNKNTQTPTQAFDRNRRPLLTRPYSLCPPYGVGYPNVPIIPVLYGPVYDGPIYDGSGFYNGLGYGGYPLIAAADGAMPAAGGAGPIAASPDPATTAQQVNAILQSSDKNPGVAREIPTNQTPRLSARIVPPRIEETGRLSKQVKVRYDSEEGMSFSWRGDTSQITKLSVTLLARYGVFLQTRVTNGVQAVTFAPGQNLVNARHYKVEVEYTDGTTAAYTAPLPFSVN